MLVMNALSQDVTFLAFFLTSDHRRSTALKRLIIT